MAINKYNLRKWFNMVRGKSVLHVNQSLGKSISVGSIGGYYNDLTQKVLMQPEYVENGELPLVLQEDGASIVFPVAIFQYALGCYDLWLQTKDEKYKAKFFQLAEWTLNTQDCQGRWDNFSHTYPKYPYGAMAQGEAASVLIRAYVQKHDERFLDGAKRGIDFMLKDVNEGGTTEYKDNYILFKEFVQLPVVLNGWIFAFWGLYDYTIITQDKGYYRKFLDQALASIIHYLPAFQSSHWSKYDLGNKITSPFYHHLHIAQMQAMYMISHRREFNDLALLWEKDENNAFFKTLAFIIKAKQKILE